MVNKVILLGNVGKDAEKVTDNVTRFSVATTERWTDKEGNPQSKTEWHRVVVFGKIASTMAELCKSGRQVYVEGKLVTSEYEKDGIKRYTTEINVDMNGRVQVIGGRDDNSSSNSNNEKPQPKKTAERQQKEKPLESRQQEPSQDYDDTQHDDDIPF